MRFCRLLGRRRRAQPHRVRFRMTIIQPDKYSLRGVKVVNKRLLNGDGGDLAASSKQQPAAPLVLAARSRYFYRNLMGISERFGILRFGRTLGRHQISFLVPPKNFNVSRAISCRPPLRTFAALLLREQQAACNRGGEDKHFIHWQGHSSSSAS